MSYERRLRDVIPGGAHVHTKGRDQFPANAPPIAKRNRGVYIFDDKGNKFLDYGMALRSVIVGYGETQINRGAIEQINNGNTSTFPTMIELEAAERLRDLIESIEMVKFCKDGSTATTAAVKLARAYTNRKMIAICADQPFFSYNDWFIGTTDLTNGCLEEDYSFTKSFNYNDIESVKVLFRQYASQLACVILEPALSNMEPQSNFLQELQGLCNKHGVILILDEMITGFRWHLKGGQYYYGVEPDLCTFGKAMSNGFSVSALGGRKDIMELGDMDRADRVFLLSSTHGAEMGGLGAFIANLDFMQEHNVIQHVWDYGDNLISNMKEVAKSTGVADSFLISGLGCLPRFTTLNKNGLWDSELNITFQREMVNNGVIMRNIAIAYRHDQQELDITKNALQAALEVYKEKLDEGSDIQAGYDS